MQESGEMYLETILILSKKGQEVRSIDISEYMKYSKPSVSRAMGLLKKRGLITIDTQGAIRLTKSGLSKASGIYERHTTISAILEKIGVSKETAAEDACRVEHYISDETFSALKKLKTRCNDIPSGSSDASSFRF
ncbi:MAG: metal-dependent transcriptional regulator [Sphaerochaetaceae bacterium]